MKTKEETKQEKMYSEEDLREAFSMGRLGKTDMSFKEWFEQFKRPTDENSDLFSAEYRGKKIKIEGKFLKQGEEIELLQKLKKYNLGSGHEQIKLSKINDDYFIFDLETYTGGPVHTVYFERLK